MLSWPLLPLFCIFVLITVCQTVSETHKLFKPNISWPFNSIWTVVGDRLMKLDIVPLIETNSQVCLLHTSGICKWSGRSGGGHLVYLMMTASEAATVKSPCRTTAATAVSTCCSMWRASYRYTHNQHSVLAVFQLLTASMILSTSCTLANIQSQQQQLCFAEIRCTVFIPYMSYMESYWLYMYHGYIYQFIQVSRLSFLQLY